MSPLALALLQACAPARPSVLLVTLDTTRADHLSPYGDTSARTPTCDRLAAEGVVYERAYSTAPLTIVSHSTILTGLAPPISPIARGGRSIIIGPGVIGAVMDRRAS